MARYVHPAETVPLLIRPISRKEFPSENDSFLRGSSVRVSFAPSLLRDRPGGRNRSATCSPSQEIIARLLRERERALLVNASAHRSRGRTCVYSREMCCAKVRLPIQVPTSFFHFSSTLLTPPPPPQPLFSGLAHSLTHSLAA